MLTMPIFCLTDENCKIVRISPTSLQETIEKEKSEIQYRTIQKWATIAVVAASVYGLVNCSDYFLSLDTKKLARGESLPVNANLAVIDSSWLIPKPIENNQEINLSWSVENMPSIVSKGIYSTGKNMIDTTMGVVQWVANSATTFVGMGLLNFGTNKVGNYWTYFNETEELSGFIKHQTKLSKYASLIKEFSIPFDIYSERLSIDLNFGAQRLMLSDFMKEMIDAVGTSNEWAQQKLLSALKKDYLQKTSMLQELQNYALKSMNCRQRIEFDLVHSSLEIEQFNRISIAEFCNLLILEIEQVIAFIEIKTENSLMKNYYSQGIQALLNATNLFAEKVETKLAFSTVELHEQSKIGDGLFDMIFDFNAFLEQNFDAMNIRLQY